MDNQKTRQHKFVEKFPVVAAILMAIFWMLLFEIIEVIINFGIHMVQALRSRWFCISGGSGRSSREC